MCWVQKPRHNVHVQNRWVKMYLEIPKFLRVFTWSTGICNSPQQNMDFLIRPVVKDSCKDVQVSFGQFIFKEVTCDRGRMKTPVHLQTSGLTSRRIEIGFLKKFPKLACQKCHPVLRVLRTESPTHLDHSWQVEHCDPHLWVGFSEFVGQGAGTPCWDKQYGKELFGRREH